MMNLRGVYTALVTPFRGEEIDWTALDGLVESQIEAGIHGLVPCGTTGESATLTVDEHDQLVAHVVGRVAGRVPVIAGAGSNSTVEAVARTRHAQEVGADAVLHVVPYYNRPDPNGILRHYEAIAGVGLPVVCYNIPSRTGVTLSLETYRALSVVPEIVATKEASGHLSLAEGVLAEHLMQVLSGDDALTFPLLCLGGHGVISVTSNLAPAEMVALYDHVISGRIAEARTQHFRLLPLFRALFLECNPAPVKAALAREGVLEDVLRLPLCCASDRTRDQIERALDELRVC